VSVEKALIETMEGVATNAQSCLVLLDAVNKLTDIVGTMVEEQAMQEARISMLEADMVKK